MVAILSCRIFFDRSTFALGGQYYIMIPPGELVQTTNSVGQQNRSNATMISATATPRIQQAAFIPLSKLDGVPSSSTHSSSSVQGYLGSDQPAPQKEVKRRVSHNEGTENLTVELTFDLVFEI